MNCPVCNFKLKYEETTVMKISEYLYCDRNPINNWYYHYAKWKGQGLGAEFLTEIICND